MAAKAKQKNSDEPVLYEFHFRWREGDKSRSKSFTGQYHEGQDFFDQHSRKGNEMNGEALIKKTGALWKKYGYGEPMAGTKTKQTGQGSAATN